MTGLLDNLNNYFKNLPDSYQKMIKHLTIGDFALLFCCYNIPKIGQLLDGLLKAKVQNLKNNLDVEYSKKGKIKILKDELKAVKNRFDSPIIKNHILPLLELTFSEYWKQVNENYKLLLLFESELSSEKKELTFAVELIEKSFLCDATEENATTKNELLHIFNELFQDELPIVFSKIVSSTVEETPEVKGKSEIAGKMLVLLSFFFVEKKWFKFLNTNLRNVKAGYPFQMPDWNKTPSSEVLSESSEKLPEHFTAIKTTLSASEVEKFFSFLYLETGNTKTPFLEKSQVEQLLKNGLSVSAEPSGTYYKLQLEGRAKTKTMILHSFHRLNLKSLNLAYEKTVMAKFLKHNFEDFKDDNIEKIKNGMRSRKPAAMFDIDKYLP